MSDKWSDPASWLRIRSGAVIKVDSLDEIREIRPDVSEYRDCSYCRTRSMGGTNCPNCGAGYEKRARVRYVGTFGSFGAMLIFGALLVFSGCAALDNPNLLGAALLMQQQANAMAGQPVHLTSCSPNGVGGLTCWNPL